MTPLRIQIRKLREQRGLTQDQLAEAAGLTRAAVSRIENGHTSRVDLDTLDSLARALDVHPGVLLERD